MNRSERRIFNIDVPFAEKARSAFYFQMDHNPVYRTFTETLGLSRREFPDTDAIPLLPIDAFKRVRLVAGPDLVTPLTFTSSGTGGMERSTHFIANPELYKASILNGFLHFYPDRPIILAWLSGYQENPYSSLVWMMKRIIEEDPGRKSDFLSPRRLQQQIRERATENRRLMIFGAAFALLDLIDEEMIPPLPKQTLLVETGGMKTHRREMSREELHRRLSEGFGLNRSFIHSEYGMCELLSQAWALRDGWFEPVPWMKVTIRDPDDPQRISEAGEEGLIGLIDLANLYSCPFLLTEDIGVSDGNGRFQVLGRHREAAMRGCNFLIDSE